MKFNILKNDSLTPIKELDNLIDLFKEKELQPMSTNMFNLFDYEKKLITINYKNYYKKYTKKSNKIFYEKVFKNLPINIDEFRMVECIPGTVVTKDSYVQVQYENSDFDYSLLVPQKINHKKIFSLSEENHINRLMFVNFEEEEYFYFADIMNIVFFTPKNTLNLKKNLKENNYFKELNPHIICYEI